jgi:hypothetical protein
MSKITKVKQTQADQTKEKYRITNWSTYNQALVNRGSITIYFSEEAIAGWYDDSPAQKGGQYVYSDLCIETLLMLKVVFKLAYRQTQGFAVSLLELMELTLEVPCYTQIQRRSWALDIEAYNIPSGGHIDIVIDSTGLKVYGEGEWKVRKHGYSKRRTWRKLHLGCDPETGFIHCFTLTDNATDDASQLEPLLDQVDADIEDACLDGAYDTEDCWDDLLDRAIWPIIPPRENAVEWYAEQEGDLPDYPRNIAIREIEKIGRKQWKIKTGYHRRSLSETAMFRFKTIHGRTLYSRKMKTQQTETKIKIKTLNIMTAQGMPVAIKIKAA